MGLLKKLASLVVEFPAQDKEKKPAAKGEGGETDVVAAIEQIRKSIEDAGTMSFEDSATSAPAGAAKEQHAGAEAAKSGAKTQGSAPGGSAITAPVPLTIAQIYEKAGLKAEGEFDIFKVERMLSDPEIADLAVELRARMVRMTLKNMGRDLKDILNDAGRRDQAMEQYLAYLERQVADTEVKIARSNEELQRKIDEFVSSHKAMIADNNGTLNQARAAIEDFRRHKAEEEQRLFDIAAPFVGDEANPVKLDQ